MEDYKRFSRAVNQLKRCMEFAKDTAEEFSNAGDKKLAYRYANMYYCYANAIEVVLDGYYHGDINECDWQIIIENKNNARNIMAHNTGE